MFLAALIQPPQTLPHAHHAAPVSLASTPRRPALLRQTSRAPCALLAATAALLSSLRRLLAAPRTTALLVLQLRRSACSGPIALTPALRSHVRLDRSASLDPSLPSPALLVPIAAVHRRRLPVLYRTTAQLVLLRQELVLKVSTAVVPAPRRLAVRRIIALQIRLLRRCVFKISTALTLTLRLPVLLQTIVQPVLRPKPSALSDPIALIFTLRPPALLAVIVLLVQRLLSHVRPDFIVPLLLRRQHAQPTTSVSPASLLQLLVPFVLLEITPAVSAPPRRMLYVLRVLLESTIRLRPTRFPAPLAASVLSASMSLQHVV